MEHLRKAVVIFAEVGAEPSSGGQPNTAGSPQALLADIWKLNEW